MRSVWRAGKAPTEGDSYAMIRDSHTDDPVCAWVAGSTCSLQIEVYYSGCLLNRVALRGKGTSDRLPVDVSGNAG